MRSVLGHRSEFKIKGPMATMLPLGNILRGLYFDNSATPGAFYPEIFILPMFRPTLEIYFNFGFRMQDSHGFSQWNTANPHLISELKYGIKNFAIPFWEKAQTVLGFATMPQEPGSLKNLNNREGIALAWARAGNIPRAIEEIDQLLIVTDYKVGWEKIIADRVSGLKKLLLEEPQKAQQQLDEWEMQTRQNLRLVGVM